MPADYHPTTIVILTDDLFDRYTPPLTVEPQSPQRQAAYLIAEQKMAHALRAPLLPSQISGTFSFRYPYEPILLPHSYVRSVDSIVAYGENSACDCEVTDLDACARLRNAWGLVDTKIIAGYYVGGCGCAAVAPSYFDIAYTAGLPTGVAADDASLHMALAMLARIEILEMLDPGALEGGGGDPGVQSYSGPDYSETRVTLKETPFGPSALANKAWRLVRHLYKPKPLKF